MMDSVKHTWNLYLGAQAGASQVSGCTTNKAPSQGNKQTSLPCFTSYPAFILGFTTCRDSIYVGDRAWEKRVWGGWQWLWDPLAKVVRKEVCRELHPHAEQREGGWGALVVLGHAGKGTKGFLIPAPHPSQGSTELKGFMEPSRTLPNSKDPLKQTLGP